MVQPRRKGKIVNRAPRGFWRLCWPFAAMLVLSLAKVLNKKPRRIAPTGLFVKRWMGLGLEAHAAAHAAHAAHVGHCRSAGRLIFRSVSDRRFGGDQQASNRCCVLQRGANDLGWVDNAGFHQVFVGVGRSVEALRLVVFSILS